MKKKERKVMRISVEGIEVIVSIAVIKMLVKKDRAANKDYVFECTFQSFVEAMTEIGKGSKPKIN